MPLLAARTKNIGRVVCFDSSSLSSRVTSKLLELNGCQDRFDRVGEKEKGLLYFFSFNFLYCLSFFTHTHTQKKSVTMLSGGPETLNEEHLQSSKIDILIGEPYFYSSLLPWHRWVGDRVGEFFFKGVCVCVCVCVYVCVCVGYIYKYMYVCVCVRRR